MDDSLLISKAVEARNLAFAPYSGFSVGAALLGKNHKIYLGANIENASYSATICAERAAVCAAVLDGCRAFEAIAVAAGDRPTPPCGICRQVLAEFGEMAVYFADASGTQFKKYMLSELLPEAFDGSRL